jgi:ABC-2 type transport system permease protein
MLPGMFLVYGVGRGARAIAGEEEHGTLELLLVTPVSGASIIAQKALALASPYRPWTAATSRPLTAADPIG